MPIIWQVLLCAQRTEQDNSCVPLALTLKSRNTEDKCMAIEYTQ